MKLNHRLKLLSRYVLSLFVLFGVVTLGATAADAQWRRDNRRSDRYDWRRDRYNSGYQIARQRGYSYGLNAGAIDAQRGQRYNPQRSRIYRNGSDGFNRSFGNRNQYRQIFRAAFLQGYREGYQRYAYSRRPNSRRWRDGVRRRW